MKSARIRLLIGIGVVLAVALAAFATLTYLLTERRLDADLDAMLRTRAFALSRLVDSNHLRVQSYVEQGLELERGGFYLQLFDGRGELIDKSQNLAEPIPLTDATKRIAPNRTEALLENRTGPHGEPLRIATFARVDRPGNPRDLWLYAQAIVSLQPRNAELQKLRGWLGVGALATLVLALGVTGLLVRQWQRSVAAVEKTAREISTQNLSRQRVFVSTDDAELARLAQAFNELLDRLDALHETQQRFVADASHELRTPLTILRGEIEVALRRPRSPAEYEATLRSNLDEIKRLGRLVENLLALARADSGEALPQREELDLAEIIRAVAGRLAPLASSREVELAVESPATIPVRGSAVGLERIVFNLTENAILHSPAGETVTLRAALGEDGASLAIEDAGPGIAPEHLPHLFERFFRVDAARSRADGGAGLGLAIVEALAKAHGARLEVASEIGRGSTFTVRGL